MDYRTIISKGSMVFLNEDEEVYKRKGTWYAPTDEIINECVKDIQDILNDYQYDLELYIVGSYLNNFKVQSGDVDLLLYSREHEKLIENKNQFYDDVYDILLQVLKVGCEKYGVYLDCQYSVEDPIEIYKNATKKVKNNRNHRYLIGNGSSFRSIKRKIPNAKLLKNNLYTVEPLFPDKKQILKIKSGLKYRIPMRLL